MIYDTQEIQSFCKPPTTYLGMLFRSVRKQVWGYFQSVTVHFFRVSCEGREFFLEMNFSLTFNRWKLLLILLKYLTLKLFKC